MLITLVIIGVIAAITVPTLIAKYQEQQIVSAVKKSYKTLTDAILMTKNREGNINTWAWEDLTKVGDNIAKSLNVAKNCKTSTGCAPDVTYKSFNVVDYNNFNNSVAYYKMILSDGTALYLATRGVSANGVCSYHAGDSQRLNSICAEVFIDINGAKKPNQLGYDTFSFYITKDTVLPMGLPDDTGSGGNPLSLCSKNTSGNQFNGKACAAWVIVKGNVDFRHHTISW